MKIYYASSIRGTQSEDLSITDEIFIEQLRKFGIVLNEHIINERIKDKKPVYSDSEIHDNQCEWLKETDIVVAEVTNPSLGVGYVLGRAVEHDKKVLCLFKKDTRKLSAMIRGSEGILVEDYETVKNGLKIIRDYFEEAGAKINNTPSIREINKSTMHGLLTGNHG